MKKIIFSIITTLVLIPSIAFGAVSMSPNPLPDGDTPVLFTSDTEYYTLYNQDGSVNQFGGLNPPGDFISPAMSWNDMYDPMNAYVASPFSTGTWHLIKSDDAVDGCQSLNMNDCITLLGSHYLGTTDVVFGSSPTPDTDGIMGLINSANNKFSSTTGFTVSAMAYWAGDNLIKVFLGSGVAILYEFRYWILALSMTFIIFLYARSKIYKILREGL